MIEDGMMAQMYAPYGSQHDGTIFQIGLCDDCVEKKKPTVIGNYMFGDIDEGVRNGTINYYEEGESNASKDSNQD